MKVLAIADGDQSSGTFNLKGIAEYSKHQMIIKQFNAREDLIDGVDLVYIHYGGIGGWKMLLKTIKERRDKPWAIGVRGPTNYQRCFPRRAPVWYVELCEGISCSNKFWQERVRMLTDIPAYLCQAGVDTKAFVPKPAPEEFVLGWAGSVSTGAKGFNRLLTLPFTLKAVGSGTKRALGDNGAGWIPHTQMPEFFASISVYVSTSWHNQEGCPMPPIEAASCGRPVVATRAGALEEWVPEEFLVDEPEEMIPIIERLRDDAEHYERTCNVFRDIALRWDFSVIAKQFDNMFDECYERYIARQ